MQCPWLDIVLVGEAQAFGYPISSAARMRVLPIEPANPGAVRSIDARDGTTTSPLGVSRRKLLMFSSRSSNGGRSSYRKPPLSVIRVLTRHSS